MIFSSILFLTLSYQVAAHGYLSSPPPRGIEKVGYQIDDLKSPNSKGLCRGEPEGQITKVKPGQMLKLGFTITAPHIGPCRVSLLDVDLTGEAKPFASKQNCAAPGGPGFWNVKLPANAHGRKVLRWYWEGQHIGTPGEPYEQCIDLDFGGGIEKYSAPKDDEETPAPYTPKPKRKKAPKKAKKPRKPHPVPSYQEGEESEEEVTNDYGNEAPSSPPSYSPAPSNDSNDYGDEAPETEHSGGGKCQHGAYKCLNHSKFAVCNWGSWVPMACGQGTSCQKAGDSIVCGH